MRFASLGSGSEGNGLVVEGDLTCVMIDCGFGVRDTAISLGSGRSPLSRSQRAVSLAVVTCAVATPSTSYQ